MTDERGESSGWVLATAVATLWAIVPCLRPLLAGELVGSPYTDLYPSAWGLAVFAMAQPGFPLSTSLFGAPEGIGFYYSSPIHGWLGAPLFHLFGPVVAYNGTLLLARAATVLAAYGWLRSLKLGVLPGLGGAMVYGASPFFHGYTVEGIVEGIDGWALPLWAWMLSRQHTIRAGLALFLCIFSSWYLGMVACGLAALWGLTDRRARYSLGLGLVLALPFLWAFAGAFGGNEPLDDAVRLAMSAQLAIPTPNVASPPSPFAINTYLGFSTVALSLLGLRARPMLGLSALACLVLSTGRGPWWDLPVFEMVRFPYRWHAGTLLCLAPLVAHAASRVPWLGFVPWLEGLLLSPISVLVPGAPVDVPALYDRVSGPVLLELPGPYGTAPGERNLSRPRARYYLWAQLTHGAASPWSLDFNGIAHPDERPIASLLAPLRCLDTAQVKLRGACDESPNWQALRAAGVTQVMVHGDQLADTEETALRQSLEAAGAAPLGTEGPLSLWSW
ncbi:MAG: hypothetical protein FJ090_13205 [Deltaproteobacteria bacterium]|nr:hypothetical protein [Deltaproteobacteria bacterium]